MKGGVTTTYGYDTANQLTSESRTGYSANYTYDDNGNRLTRSISGGVSETYTYDAGDKLTGVTWSGGYKDFAYDNAGRMTEYDNNGSVRYFAYDEEGRMTGISGAMTASYTYNGLRTRTSKTENSVTNDFRRDGSGVTSPVLNDGSASYTPGISERRGSTTTYLNSGLKNAEAQTNTSQTIAAERTYDAFGNVTAGTGTWQGPFGHAGQFGYQEDASGYQLLGHRFYDPTIGRFLTRDPIQDGRNWYAYCENNPVVSHDASGLAQEKPDSIFDRLLRRKMITKGQRERLRNPENRSRAHDIIKEEKKKDGRGPPGNASDEEWAEAVDEVVPDAREWRSTDLFPARPPLIDWHAPTLTRYPGILSPAPSFGSRFPLWAPGGCYGDPYHFIPLAPVIVIGGGLAIPSGSGAGAAAGASGRLIIPRLIQQF